MNVPRVAGRPTAEGNATVTDLYDDYARIRIAEFYARADQSRLVRQRRRASAPACADGRPICWRLDR